MGRRPSALGSGRSGPRGVGSPLPSPPRLRLPPAPHHGAEAPRRTPLVLPAAAVERGLPGGHGAGQGRVPRACAPRVPGGAGGGGEHQHIFLSGYNSSHSRLQSAKSSVTEIQRARVAVPRGRSNFSTATPRRTPLTLLGWEVHACNIPIPTIHEM